MKAKLENWVNNGWLERHQATGAEIANLLNVGDRDLEKSRTPGLGPDWKFNISYSATLAFAQAALVACGYRAKGPGHHYWTILSLEFTLGVESDIITQLDNYRSKRNTNVYQQAGVITDLEADEMHELALKLRDDLYAWLATCHPELLLK